MLLEQRVISVQKSRRTYMHDDHGVQSGDTYRCSMFLGSIGCTSYWLLHFCGELWHRMRADGLPMAGLLLLQAEPSTIYTLVLMYIHQDTCQKAQSTGGWRQRPPQGANLGVHPHPTHIREHVRADFCTHKGTGHQTVHVCRTT